MGTVVTTYTGAAIQNAIDASRANGGGVINLLPGKYAVSSTINTYPNITIIGSGVGVTNLVHAGNNTCIKVVGRTTNEADLFEFRGCIKDLSVIGNAGKSAMGIDIVDTVGFNLSQIMVSDFDNGTGVRLYNQKYWTENTVLRDVTLRYNKIGLMFFRTVPGTDSFGYTQISNLLINTGENGIAIDFGGGSVNGCNIYHANIQACIWLDGLNSVGVYVRNSATIQMSRVYIQGEGGGKTQRGLINKGVVRCEGIISIWDVTSELNKNVSMQSFLGNTKST